jgi:hypothetical protein
VAETSRKPPNPLGRLRSRVDAAIRWRAAEAVDPVARRAEDVLQRVARVERKAEWSANELRRLAPQVAAIEARLADIDDRLRRAQVDGAATDAERGARRLTVAARLGAPQRRRSIASSPAPVSKGRW